jgi:selenocysteine lyase/cysteine desulfurase
MVFHLKSVVGSDMIMRREHIFFQRALRAFEQNPNICILGNTKVKRLSICSFLIRHGKYYLHHNFLCALLNDLFGIQARSGCACAGPYLQVRLRMTREMDSQLEYLVGKCGYWGLKPGVCRLNFNFFYTQAEVDYVIDAVLFLAEHAWKFAPEYCFEPFSGKWFHRRYNHNKICFINLYLTFIAIGFQSL